MSSSPSPPASDGAGICVDRQSPYLRINSVNIYVRDHDRSLDFYLNKLGFHLAFDAVLQTGQRWVAVGPRDGTAVLTLIAPPPDSRLQALIGQPTQVVFVTEDVVATYREWRSRGVQFRHAPRLRRVRYEPGEGESGAQAPEKNPIWGGVFTSFEDEDHNSFALVSFDEVNQAIEQQRRALAERLEAERRAAQEMEIARQVQARLFPQTLPVVRTLEYAGVCLQARQVGGDYYDFLNLGQDRLGLVIGDIAGKGIAAALLMANLQAALRSQCAIALDQPGRFLQSVNQLFYENTGDNGFATLFFAEYDDRTHRLRYANCGHLSGLLLRAAGGVERLESTCTILGAFAEWDCEVEERGLGPGDTLALYTDGVTESFSAGGEEFGEQRLVQALCRNRELAPGALLEAVLQEVRAFSPGEQHDDITMIVARCKE